VAKGCKFSLYALKLIGVTGNNNNNNNNNTRRMRWAEHIARMREKRNAYRILVENPEERGRWEHQDVGGWTILKWILEI
jgi:hypothetical protein